MAQNIFITYQKNIWEKELQTLENTLIVIKDANVNENKKIILTDLTIPSLNKLI